ncbi:MAG: FAA hydrolase family protein, partial [Roseateles sp.]
MQRRQALGATMSALAATGCASTAAPTVTTATPFALAQPSVPIAGSAEVFPVRRIYCIGRNYAAHAREMGSDPTREPP